MTEDEMFMKKAIGEAQKAKNKEEVPIGCVIVLGGKVIAKGYNKRQTTQNATNHAEIIAIQKACKKLKSWRLDECSIYVTCEPCAMCSGAILNARIKRIVFGADSKLSGCCKSKINLFDKNMLNTSSTQICDGVLKEECSALLKDFFKNHRKER